MIDRRILLASVASLLGLAAFRWLRASPAVLARRFSSGDYRPIYGSDPGAVARAQSEQRDPLYAAVARITIEEGERDVSEVTAAAMAALAPLLSSRRPPG